MSEALRAPFPWFGGKSRAAPVIWERFGDVVNYLEAFAGSLAVLLARPHEPRIETVNDLDCYLANFWRAMKVKGAPDEVARWADDPVNEADLHARHKWLVGQVEFRERMLSEPEYFDAKIAGWWVWGISCWLGRGWCDAGLRTRSAIYRTIPATSAQGVRSQRCRDLVAFMHMLQTRLRRVDVLCGDWTRAVKPSYLWHRASPVGVVLDPPYPHDGGLDPNVYANDDGSVWYRAAKWAEDHGDDPRLRIALCGYSDTWQAPPGWTEYAWKANGGYGGQSDGENVNAKRERIWFSPHCIAIENVKGTQLSLLNRPVETLTLE